MDPKEVQHIVQELKKGKTYFKPLPDLFDEGGTRIVFIKEKGIFKEHFVRRNMDDWYHEERNLEYNESELLDMFINQTYTDAREAFSIKQDDYKLLSKE